MGLSIDFKTLEGNIEPGGYTGHVFIYIVHTDPSLHKVKVQGTEGMIIVDKYIHYCYWFE